MVARISHKHLKFHLGIENAFNGCTKSINSTIEVRDFKTPALFAGNAFYANLRQQICKKNDQRLIAKKHVFFEKILFCFAKYMRQDHRYRNTMATPRLPSAGRGRGRARSVDVDGQQKKYVPIVNTKPVEESLVICLRDTTTENLKNFLSTAERFAASDEEIKKIVSSLFEKCLGERNLAANGGQVAAILISSEKMGSTFRNMFLKKVNT